jgi:branched-chain amino acid transport system ATP-binding protein
MTAPLLQLRGVTKRFGGLVANAQIDLEVRPGEIVGVIGPNGAGKTTLFDVITGYYPPTAGEILFRNQRINGLSPDRVNRLGIARTFQKLRPFLEMTTLENVMVAALPRCASLAEAKAIADEALGFVGLEERRHVPATGLSTGQRKRLELARAMVTRPALLLLDEVTGGVDQRSIPGLLDLVQRLRAKEVTLLVIEHNMRVIMALADRVIALHLGRLIAAGGPLDVAQSPGLREAYFGKTHARDYQTGGKVRRVSGALGS